MNIKNRFFKKVAVFLILGAFLFPQTTHAFTLNDLAKQVQSLKTEVLGLKKQLAAQAFGSLDSTKSTDTTAPVSSCNSTSTPSVTIVSPNGGETYVEGQEIKLKWSSCNIPPENMVTFGLLTDLNSNTVFVLHDPSTDSITFVNSGQATIKLPIFASAGDPNSWQYGKHYKINITTGGSIGPYAVDNSDNLFTINPQKSDLDPTPRIAYWTGKVNQHVDTQGNWQSDPDGVSGTNIDKLTYCKKWYSNTTSVEPYKSETITTWHRNIMYEQSNYTATVVSDKCVQGTTSPKASITVLSPNGGEVYQSGQQVTVNWTSTNIPASTLLEVNIYSSNPQVFGFLAPNGTPNDGSETFNLSSLPDGSNYIITVGVPLAGFDNSALSISDQSDKPFTITSKTGDTTCGPRSTPSITVLSPNGGEMYTPGQQVLVKWKSCNIPEKENVRIDLDVAPFPPLGTNGVALANTPNDGQELVTLPATSVFNGSPMSLGKNFKVNIWRSVYSGTTAPGDLSDDLFTINTATTEECINSMQTMVTNPRLKNWGVVNPSQTPSRILIADVTVKACGDLSLNSSEITVQATSGPGAFSSFEALDGTSIVASGTVFQSQTGGSWVTLTYNSPYHLSNNQSKTLSYWGYLNPLSNGTGYLTIMPSGTPTTNPISMHPGDEPYTAADASFTMVPGSGKGVESSTGKDSSNGNISVAKKVLQVGSKGDDVKALQQYLTDKGLYSGPINSRFGPMTKEAVKKLQNKYNIAQTGSVGPQTLKLLTK